MVVVVCIPVLTYLEILFGEKAPAFLGELPIEVLALLVAICN
jgi:hypothetical protein